jgi:hypothetical protein
MENSVLNIFNCITYLLGKNQFVIEKLKPFNQVSGEPADLTQLMELAIQADMAQPKSDISIQLCCKQI